MLLIYDCRMLLCDILFDKWVILFDHSEIIFIAIKLFFECLILVSILVDKFGQ